VKAARVLIAIALALVLQTTLARFVVGGSAAIDLVLVVVVSVALTMGPATGLVAGSVAGIAQDALSSGVIGVGGLAKSIVGFAAGAIGQQFIVAAALPRFVMFLAATLVHAGIFMGLYMALELRSFPAPWTAAASQSLMNAFVGVLTFAVIESLPGIAERRRARRVRH
jgi:rod shape-determining protein MreD